MAKYNENQKYEGNLKKFTLTTLPQIDIPPSINFPDFPEVRRKPNLTTSTSFTNFPEPCQVCKLNQCQFDLTHQLSLAISGAVDKAFYELNSAGALDQVFSKFNCKIEPPDET